MANLTPMQDCLDRDWRSELERVLGVRSDINETPVGLGRIAEIELT